MLDEMQEGWGTCPYCKKKYLVRKVKFPCKDISHDVVCPSCGEIVGWVPKGTDDFFLQTEEDFKKYQEEEASRPRCPKCGKKMVKRKGFTEFWGCSNYPSCDGTRKIH